MRIKLRFHLLANGFAFATLLGKVRFDSVTVLEIIRDNRVSVWQCQHRIVLHNLFGRGSILEGRDDGIESDPRSAHSNHATRVDSVTRRVTAAQTLLARDDSLASLRASYDHALRLSPDDWILHRNAGMMLLARGAPAEALPHLERAHAWINDDAETLLALARTHQALNHATEADRLFALARELEPTHPAFKK